jgi:hypothetical protein
MKNDFLKSIRPVVKKIRKTNSIPHTTHRSSQTAEEGMGERENG